MTTESSETGNSKHVHNQEWTEVDQIRSLGNSLGSSQAPGYPPLPNSARPRPPTASSKGDETGGPWPVCVAHKHSAHKPGALLSPLRTLAPGPWIPGKKLMCPPPSLENQLKQKTTTQRCSPLRWPSVTSPAHSSLIPPLTQEQTVKGFQVSEESL